MRTISMQAFCLLLVIQGLIPRLPLVSIALAKDDEAPDRDWKKTVQEKLDVFKKLKNRSGEFLREAAQEKVESLKNLIHTGHAKAKDANKEVWEAAKREVDDVKKKTTKVLDQHQKLTTILKDRSGEFLREAAQEKVESLKNMIHRGRAKAKDASTEAWEAAKSEVDGVKKKITEVLDQHQKLTTMLAKEQETNTAEGEEF